MNIQYAAYLIVAIFFVMDFLIRKDSKATSMRKTKDDNNTTKFIVLTFLAILLSAEVFNYFHLGQFDNTVLAIVALMLMLSGLVIRIYAMSKLRAFYTRTLLTTDQQVLITTGLYKTIRHPGYLGTMLIWVFFGFAVENYFVVVIGILLTFIAYSYRIRNEETMLLSQFGQAYEDYQKSTWRIMPYVW